MIKGINRQVIEINDTGTTYYEKAWLIVKPAYAGLHQSILEKEARSLLKDLDAPSSIKPKRNRRFLLLRMGIAAVSGAAVCLLAQTLF